MAEPGIIDQTAGEQTARECGRHLKAISDALKTFEQEHGELPHHLTDLLPGYLSDLDTLHCPCDTTPGTPGWGQDDATSYLYEMSGDAAPGGEIQLGPQKIPTSASWRDRKLAQRMHFGDRVPVVRCRHHQGLWLNLSPDGEVYHSGGAWETDPAFRKVVFHRLGTDLASGPKQFADRWSPTALEDYFGSLTRAALPPGTCARLGELADQIAAAAPSLPEDIRPDAFRLAAGLYVSSGRMQDAIHACDLALRARRSHGGSQSSERPLESHLLEILRYHSRRRSNRPPAKAFLKLEMARKRIPGVSVLVARNGKVLLAEGLGTANLEHSVPSTSDTVYQIGSITKQFTAAAVLLLMEEGKLTLDDRIGQHLPDLPDHWNAVTVRQLLTHTSGIKSYTSLPDFPKTFRKDFTPDEIIGLTRDFPLEFTPGEKMSYCNTGYFLLGLIIEKVSGKSYEEFLSERIFQPLGMTATRHNDQGAIVPGRAGGYTLAGEELRNGEYVSPSQPFAAGALISTVRDLARWDAALWSNRVLRPETFHAMKSPTILTNGEKTEYGFGLALGKLRGHEWVGHGGGIPGFLTFAARFPGSKITIILLTNFDRVDPGLLAFGVASFYLPAPRAFTTADQTTARRLRKLLANASEGLDAGSFTPEAWNALLPDRDRIKAFYRALGRLKTFRILTEESKEGKNTFGAWTNFEHGAWLHTFTLQDGKLTDLRVEPA